MKNLPSAIIDETLREQDRQGWPDMAPRFAEYINSEGKHVFCDFKDMTVARCEQAAEFHRRQAILAIARFEASSPRAARKAAFHIIRARFWRCQFFTLTGQEGTTEDDMPFPHHCYDE
jgi:hypothetical protein